MIRTETTLVIGAGANCEIEMPDGAELLNRIAAGYDFDRLGTQVQTRDMVALAAIFEQNAERLGTSYEALLDAGRTIKQASRVTSSIDAVLEQYGSDNPDVIAAGKLALAYYTLQAEQKSTLAVEPRDAGDLPLRGTENWLFQLGQLITKGVPRAKAEQCFDNLSIVCFNYDRAIEHYMPWVLTMAFGMPMEEAQMLVSTHLRIVHPYGSPGSLPWMFGAGEPCQWGEQQPEDWLALAKGHYTASERGRDKRFSSFLMAEIAHGKRLGFLGFGFDPMNTSMLFDRVLDHDPDVMVALTGIGAGTKKAVHYLLKRNTGVQNPDLIQIEDMKAYQLLRDNGLFLET
ncbi:MAG: hypothetical protein AAF249_00890 [Pseudomonadota bacterium]